MVRRRLRFFGASRYRCPATSTTLRSTAITRAAGSTWAMVRAASSPPRRPHRSPLWAAVFAISSSRSPCRPAARAWPSLVISVSAGISAGSTNSADSPATLTCGAGSARSPACQCGRGVDDLLHVPGLDVLADDRVDDRGGEPLAQAALGMRVLAGPPILNREPVR